MNKPYIGVTDFISHAQALEVASALTSDAHRLHVGAMISYKTLNKIPTSTGWEKIWLKSSDMKALFCKHPKLYNVIHYADYDDLTTLSDLIEVVIYAGSGIDAIQLDMKWPHPELLQGFKAIYPTIDIIQQIGHTAIKESSNWERDLAMYEGVADYVLLDCGMGKGIPFSPDYMIELVETALLYFDQNQIAVAGGLGPTTYLNLQPVLEKYPHISCDAQGRLRASGNATDPMNVDFAKQYVTGVCSLF